MYREGEREECRQGGTEEFAGEQDICLYGGAGGFVLISQDC